MPKKTVKFVIRTDPQTLAFIDEAVEIAKDWDDSYTRTRLVEEVMRKYAKKVIRSREQE
jgi:hypothetical protein